MLAGAAPLLSLQPLAAQAVVQAVPPPELGDLQAALAVLARDPSDLGALIRAGKASIALGDLQAALGFFRRAQAISPHNGEVEAGLAAVTLRQGEAVEAVKLFEQAGRDGVPPASHASDHGLALDLVGDNVAAQRFYREALKQGDDPEVLRRLALSQAISGDQRGSEATFLPLLQRSDLAAYRTRAFAMAILGRGEEAVSIAETMLPESLSNRMAPYLRYMPRLTRAQQAAAANLGQFPPANEIGHDSPAMAAYSARSAPQLVAASGPDARLQPAGEPLGSSQRSGGRNKDRDTARVAPTQAPAVATRAAAARPTPTPTPAPIASAPVAPTPAATTAPKASQPVLVASIKTPPPPSSTSAVATSGAIPRPSLSISEPRAAPPAPEEETVDTRVSLAEAFADLSRPPATGARPKSGAVDITKIDPPREKPVPPPPPKPKPPVIPKRYWVQVATGRDVHALAFDWRRIKREGADLLKSSDAYTASWGQTNRLVTGPYDSASDAQKAVTALRAKGLDTFAFTSEQGEEVRPLK